jgi:hypothetical protein
MTAVHPAQHRADRREREQPAARSDRGQAGVDLYWLPLGAGGHSVRLNGKVFEAVAAWLARRERRDLYHAGLQVCVPEGRFVIEQAPAWGEGSRRGVVAEGPVGLRALGRFRLFRYEIRRWRDGAIPDIAEAVDSPRRLGDDPLRARRLLDLVPQVPTPVWGRDELRAGEMWNSNSMIAWLLARSGLDVDSIHPPLGGRAPGWRAGIVVAQRQSRRTGSGVAIDSERIANGDRRSARKEERRA